MAPTHKPVLDHNQEEDEGSKGSHHHHHLYMNQSDLVLGRPSPRKIHGVLAEDFHSQSRQTSLAPAVFSLINTVIGGGVLSLSNSFQDAGALAACLFLLVVCFATDFTLFALISASRRTGANSYEEVMRRAFGTPAQVLVILMVLVITFLTPVAYLILLRDLISAVFEAYLLSSPMTAVTKTIVISAIAIAVTPLTFASSMGFIGSLAVFSMVSILILAVVVTYRCVECAMKNGMPSLPLVNTTDNWMPLIRSIPVFVCVFLCHFNILPIFVELKRPTRARAHNLAHLTMTATLLLYLVIGLAGYTYGVCKAGRVEDNILSSFDADDDLVNIARVGVSVVLCFCFPLLVIPCRENLLRLMELIVGQCSLWGGGGVEGDEDGAWVMADSDTLTPLLSADGDSRVVLGEHEGGEGGGGHQEEGEEEEALSPSSLLASPSARHGIVPSKPPRPPFRQNLVLRLLVTVTLVLSIVVLASLLDSVAVVWEVMGSVACVMIGFIFPAAAYLKVGCRRQRVKRVVAWIILVVSVGIFALCTSVTVHSLATHRIG